MCNDEKRSCITINCGCCEENGGEPVENVYSTEETVCGTWIDGKPIYRKVISGKLPVDSAEKYAFANVSDLKVDKLINLYGNMVDKYNKFQVVMQTTITRADGSSAAVVMYYGVENEYIYCFFSNNRGDYSGCTAYVVIEYTKK
ncbi:MAG: hypothetical protein QM657_18395 [Lacrimispora sp.]|uniref:hypothetical protein n=1 Tax=Lacrimispora sp. TaxID=2719234 RepID=UPI0039E60725